MMYIFTTSRPLFMVLGPSTCLPPVALLVSPLHPMARHLADVRARLLRDGINPGNCFERPEPMIRLPLQFAQEQRNGLVAHADDLLVSLMSAEFDDGGRVTAFCLPLCSECCKSLFQLRKL